MNLTTVTTIKTDYCRGPKAPLKPKKALLKVHLTFSGGCYRGSSSRHYCRCHYRSIVAVTKSAAINLPFSSGFGLLRRAKKPLPYEVRIWVNWPFSGGICTPLYVFMYNQPYAHFSGGYALCNMCEALAMSYKCCYKVSIITLFFYL